MAQNVSGAFREASLAEVEASWQAYREAANRYVPSPQPKLTRIQRARNRLRSRIRDTRTAVGKRIAPWLGEGYY
jgi:hypothetical protein